MSAPTYHRKVLCAPRCMALLLSLFGLLSSIDGLALRQGPTMLFGRNTGKGCPLQPERRQDVMKPLFSYMEYLDSLSGKKFRSKRKKTVVQKVIDTSDGLVGKFASKELAADIQRRRKYYASDWTDAFKKKSQVIPAILFLYFACLSPAVSFGTIANQITNGSIGIVEFLLSSGFSGMAYAVMCGQPMAFIAPTGLTLAFISGLFRYCTLKGLPFFPIYTWVGLWTSLFMVSLGLSGSSKFIKYCTRFTDEVFNGLLSFNFLYEAYSSLKRNFLLADPMNLTMPFVALAMALTTFVSMMKVIAFQTTRFFNKQARAVIKNFGPVTIFILMSIINQLPWFKKFGVPTLSVPDTFQLAGGRSLLIPLMDVPLKVRLMCSFPAILLTSLFFMDQNISVRVVNNPDNQLKKGEAYNLDMLALGLITAASSLVGLPWMCGATVQSMNHVRAMTETKYNEETDSIEICEVTETRVTGFVIHALLACTLFFLPTLRFVPIPVVSGVFLYLGRKLMSGNSFFVRIKDSIAESKRLPEDHPLNTVGRKKMNFFTLIQIFCLAGVWSFKQNTATAIFFPSVIGLLMAIRSFVLPKLFTEKELTDLGDATP